jgi:hypothetical protein
LKLWIGSQRIHKVSIKELIIIAVTAVFPAEQSIPSVGYCPCEYPTARITDHGYYVTHRHIGGERMCTERAYRALTGETLSLFKKVDETDRPHVIRLVTLKYSWGGQLLDTRLLPNDKYQYHCWSSKNAFLPAVPIGALMINWKPLLPPGPILLQPAEDEMPVFEFNVNNQPNIPFFMDPNFFK